MIKIAIDVMGGDKAPISNIDGAVDFLTNFNGESTLYLVGAKREIENHLSNYSSSLTANIEIIHASDIVDSNDSPSRIVKTKPNSSMIKSINLLKDGVVDAVVSAGNTGCLLSSSFFNLGMIDGIKRPALFAMIPSENGDFLICDVGANSTAKPEHLLQFSQMSSIYMQHQIKINKPSIGLLNIGSEPKKGNELTKITYDLLKNNLDNFIGNIESRYIFQGKADIIICDGFTGNIVLKLIEGVTYYHLESISSKLDLTNNKQMINLLVVSRSHQSWRTKI